MGIANYEEYSLIHDLPDSEKEKTLTLRKQDKTLTRDHKKMEELKRKLHTDDDSECPMKFSLYIDQCLFIFSPLHSCMAGSFENITTAKCRRVFNFDTQKKAFFLG